MGARGRLPADPGRRLSPAGRGPQGLHQRGGGGRRPLVQGELGTLDRPAVQRGTRRRRQRLRGRLQVGGWPHEQGEGSPLVRSRLTAPYASPSGGGGADVRRVGAAGVLVLVLALGLTACSDSKNSGSGSPKASKGPCTPAGPFKPVKADTLTVVTSLPGPGFWEGSDSDPSKIKAGYEYDLAKALKDRLCLSSLAVRNESFDAIVGGQVNGYDLALSQVSITDKRKKVVDFTQPYFESQQGVLVKKGGKIKVTSIDDAKKIQWGVQTATTAIDLLNVVKPAKRPQVYQSLADAYTALDAGQIDAVLIDTAINLGEAARSKGTFAVVSQFAQPSGPDQYGGIVPKGSVNVGTLDKILATLKSSGSLAALATKDLTTDPGKLPTITVS
ncbi:MAG: hypothetical protein DLM59_15605 [Pseudonocardiales bacterium]|nr:MAG: hypothetical protein DLM59_15605 [Pseudonocardiales bacterium]